MEEARIVPEMIDVAPSKTLQISYPSGAFVNQGNHLTPTQVKDKPILHWDGEADELYLVVMSDMDAPAGMNEVRHWLVINIPGNKVSKGQTVIDFVGSGPSLGSGKHRYVFLVFRQQEQIQTNLFISKTTKEGRLQTKVRDLIKEHNLAVPVAGNFFFSQYDDYVPILHSTFEN